MEHEETENLPVGRQRKKKLIGEVKDLMEFYFSPVNLGKDKFMIELLQKDSFIDLDIFHRFNKIKALTKDTKILQKAIKQSEILQLSEDGLKVCRTAPAEMKNDEDACTIYAENLPPNSTHDWLRKVFSLYGSIDYISLPRFQQTGRPKGFAFIEFQTPQEAQRALEAFGGLASLDGTLYPEDLRTIKTYKRVREEEDALGIQEDATPKDENMSRKRSSEEAFADQSPEHDDGPEKKQKLEDEEVKHEPESASGKKKKRKRNKKGKVGLYEPDSIYLKVMSKKEWKILRNKYLNTQRKNMKQLKLQMYYKNDNSQIDRSNMLQTDTETDKSNQIPQYIPDVIVKIALSDPPEDPKSFQKGLRNGRQSIAYIDASSESKDVYIRFKMADDAKQFVKEKLWDRVCLLQGDDEKDYWEKVIDSWHKKRPKGKKKHMANEGDILVCRGRDKLVTKALRHNSFDTVNTRVVFDE